MSLKEFPPWVLVVILGAVTFVMLHIHFVTAWEELYAAAPWEGFEAAAREGLLDPWFGSTPRSLRVSQGVLLVLAAVVGIMRADDAMKAGVALWVGVLIPLIPVLFVRAVTTDSGLVTLSPMTDLPITWFSIPLEALRTAAPVFVGILAGLILRRTVGILFGR